MIITRLTGGLGNQMFQYAAGYALARRNRTILKLDATWYEDHPNIVAHEEYGLHVFNIVEQFATNEEIRSFDEQTNFGKIVSGFFGRRRSRRNYHSAEKFTYYPHFFDLRGDCYIIGHWQSEKFFCGAEQHLRRQFTARYQLPPSADALMREIDSNSSAVAVHFRRGDYVTGKWCEHAKAIPGEYYDRSIQQLLSLVKTPVLYVFSDDIQFVANVFKPQCETKFVIAGKDWLAADEMMLMSHCKHHVIANSTFSWWAAWLGKWEKQIVLAPSPWFSGNNYDTADVVPVGWKKIESSLL